MSKLYKCTFCGKSKQLFEFYLRSSGTVGEYKCICCLKKKRQQHNIDNHEKVRETNRKSVSKYQKKYPEKNTAKVSAYRAKKIQAIPSWLSDTDLSKIKSIYKLARNISKKTGIKHHVDHVVPLVSDIVCGLHVPWNLQVIPAEVNIKKSNKLIEDIV